MRGAGGAELSNAVLRHLAARRKRTVGNANALFWRRNGAQCIVRRRQAAAAP